LDLLFSPHPDPLFISLSSGFQFCLDRCSICRPSLEPVDVLLGPLRAPVADQFPFSFFVFLFFRAPLSLDAVERIPCSSSFYQFAPFVHPASSLAPPPPSPPRVFAAYSSFLPFRSVRITVSFVFCVRCPLSLFQSFQEITRFRHSPPPVLTRRFCAIRVRVLWRDSSLD